MTLTADKGATPETTEEPDKGGEFPPGAGLQHHGPVPWTDRHKEEPVPGKNSGIYLQTQTLKRKK